MKKLCILVILVLLNGILIAESDNYTDKELQFKGEDLFAEGKYSESLAVFEKALELNPNNSILWLGKFSVLDTLGQHENALAAYKKALEIDPEDYLIWYDKAFHLAVFFNKTTEALQAYEKSVELEPDFYLGWSGKGDVLRKMKRYEESIKAYDKSIELNPDSGITWFNKGLALTEWGKLNDAIAVLDRAQELKPIDAWGWYQLAEVSALNNDKKNALIALTKSIRLDKDRKEGARNNISFKNLWDDDEFKKITDTSDGGVDFHASVNYIRFIFLAVILIIIIYRLVRKSPIIRW